MNQTDQILEALQRGQVLTPLDALDRFGCFRLAARIADLRLQGHVIQSERRDLPNGKHIAAYWMAVGPAQKSLAFG